MSASGFARSFEVTSSCARIHGACAMGRRSSMEDTCVSFTSLSPKHPSVHGSAVFDGHGGKEVSSLLRTHFQSVIGDLDDPFEATQVQSAIYALDDMILGLEVDSEAPFGHLQNPRKCKSGSTLCAMLYKPETQQLLAINVGDSRAVVYAPGHTESTASILWRSTDHKPDVPGERRRIVSCPGGFVSDGRVRGNLALSRALGDFGVFKSRAPSMQTSEARPKQMVSSQADITLVREFDPCRHVVLVMTDGLLEPTTTDLGLIQEIERATSLSTDLVAARVLNQVHAWGSSDNLTLVIMNLGMVGMTSLQVPPTDNNGSPRTPTNQPILKPTYSHTHSDDDPDSSPNLLQVTGIPNRDDLAQAIANQPVRFHAIGAQDQVGIELVSASSLSVALPGVAQWENVAFTGAQRPNHVFLHVGANVAIELALAADTKISVPGFYLPVADMSFVKTRLVYHFDKPICMSLICMDLWGVHAHEPAAGALARRCHKIPLTSTDMVNSKYLIVENHMGWIQGDEINDDGVEEGFELMSSKAGNSQ